MDEYQNFAHLMMNFKFVYWLVAFIGRTYDGSESNLFTDTDKLQTQHTTNRYEILLLLNKCCISFFFSKYNRISFIEILTSIYSSCFDLSVWLLE